MYRIGRADETGTLVSEEALLVGYYPCVMNPLTRTTNRGGRLQCQMGSLTGAVASSKVTEAPKGSPQNGWKSFEECKGRRELDCETYKSR